MSMVGAVAGVANTALAVIPGQGAKLTRGVLEGSSAMSHWGKLGFMGAASLGGGAVSYATGGSFLQGAAAGGLAGMGGSQLSRAVGKSFTNSSGLYSAVSKTGQGLAHRFGGKGAQRTFTQGMQAVGQFASSKGSRRYAFGAGAMLGGMMFGGSSSHSRGFNGQRGNRFGR